MSDKNDYKLVLFGAGLNGKRQAADLINRGIVPAYFVDNNTNTKSVHIDARGGGCNLT